jgi:hypothetical protein
VTVGLLVSLAGLLLVQSATPSQTDSRARFSGTWRLDPERSESAASGDAAEAVTVEIAQTDRELTIATAQGGRRHQVAYVFTSGPPAPYGIDGSAGRASWNGEALITEGTRLIQGQTVATRETRRLNADATEMMVEVVVIVQHGYQFRGARNYGIGKDVYTRVR